MRKAIYYTLLFLLVSMIGALAAQTINSLTHATAETSTMVTIGSVIVANVVVFIIFIWRKYCPVSRYYVRTKPWKVAVWCCIASLGTIIPSVWLEEHLSFLPDLSEGMEGMFGTPLGYIAIAICAPICEEVVFRGAIIRALMDWRKNWKLAVVISALLFSIAHMNPAQMPHAFLLGLLLGWVFIRTNSVVPGIIIHGVNNLVVFIVASTIPSIEDMSLADLYGGSEMKAGFSVLFSLLILIPAIFQLHLNMKEKPEIS